MGLEFSLEQKQLTSVFKRYRNSIDIYTEDKEADKIFYIELLKRLMNGTNVKIEDIYPLGCSNEVIRACREDNDRKRKKIYIVDGDIYILYSPKSSIKNLFVLDSYCIENFVIDKDAVINLFYDLLGIKNKEEINQCIKFDTLLDDMKKYLIDLFFNYALMNKYRKYFILYNIYKYTDGKTFKIDSNKIQDEINVIKGDLINSGCLTIDEYNKELAIEETLFPRNIDTLLKVVSGKDFLIPYISVNRN